MSILNSLKSLFCLKSEDVSKTKMLVSLEEKASKFIDAVGGKENIEVLDNCITRLRLTLKDRSLVNKAQLNQLGSKGNVNVGEKGLQIIIGSKAEVLSDLMRGLLFNLETENDISLADKADKLIEAIGGKENIEVLDNCITRLRLTLKDRSLVNREKLNELGSKGNVNVGLKGLQIIIGIKADKMANLMREKVPLNSVSNSPKEEGILLEKKAKLFIEAVGGKENIETLDCCITRLRLTLKDRSLVNKSRLNDLGSKGNVKVGSNGLQIIIGSKAEAISDLIRINL